MKRSALESLEGVKDAKESAWHDSDDEAMQVDISSKRRLWKLRKTEKDEIISGLEYEQRLRAQFEKIHGTSAAQWADAALAEHSDSESEAEIFQTSSRMVLKAKGGRIEPRTLKVMRTADVTKQKKGNAVVQNVRFHPNDEVVMTCGFDKTLRLYHLDNDQNPLVGSYHFENFPISGAEFTSDGNACIVAGYSKAVWRFDVESGQARQVKLAGHNFSRMFSVTQGQRYIGLGADGGQAAILDERTNRLAKLVRMNADTRALAFHPTKNSLYTADSEAHIYEWDIGSGRCITRFRDESAVCCSSLAVSPDGKQLAVGTNSGIVDFFDASGPKLVDKVVKSVTNLQTTVTTMRFHPSNDIFAIASKFGKKALKMVHMPTYSVYANWPSLKTPISTPTCLDFSRQGGYMAIGNADGKVLLYTLKHYHR
eukprot:GEMP01050239.1.p1 GENE.GEMP01050239.1~~GEMP01050239.1.p1  ORF type:complete len:435 (+),score=85.29 GEMP01050239.1:31-1305(+)